MYNGSTYKKNITRKKELKTFNSLEARRAHTYNLS